MKRIALIALVASTATAAAAPKTTRLQMKREEASNLHIAGGRGAINLREEWSITVDLAPRGTVAVSSSGMRNEHNLVASGSSSYNTDDDATWTTRWTGTWAQKGRTLHLVLALADHTCKREKKEDDYAPENVPCETADASAELDCTMDEVEVYDPKTLDPAGKKSTWRCTPTKGELGETPAWWVLGRPGCVLTTGGPKTGGVKFRRC